MPRFRLVAYAAIYFNFLSLLASPYSYSVGNPLFHCLLDHVLYARMGKVKSFDTEAYDKAIKRYENIKSKPEKIIRRLIQRQSRGPILLEEKMAAFDLAFPNRPLSFRKQVDEIRNLKIAEYIVDLDISGIKRKGTAIKSPALKELFHSTQKTTDPELAKQSLYEISDTLGIISANQPSTWPWKSSPNSFSKSTIDALMSNVEDRADVISDLGDITKILSEKTTDSLNHWKIWDLMEMYFVPFYNPVNKIAGDNVYIQTMLKDPTGETTRKLMESRLGLRLKSKWVSKNIHIILLGYAAARFTWYLGTEAPDDIEELKNIANKKDELLKATEDIRSTIDYEALNNDMTALKAERESQQAESEAEIKNLPELSAEETAAALETNKGLMDTIDDYFK